MANDARHPLQHSWQQLWATSIVCDAEQALPRPVLIGEGRSDDRNYRSEGSRRRDQVSICYITLAGEGCFQDATGSHRLRPGSALLNRVCDPSTRYYYPRDANQPWHWIWIAFAGRLAHETIGAQIEQDGPVYTIGRQHALCTRIQALGKRRVQHLHLDAHEAWQWFSAVIEAVTAAVDRKASDLAARARRRLLDQLHNPPGLGQLARELGCSREHLSRRFTARYGETPGAFLRRHQCSLALQLLQGSALPIAEIARRCGYRHAGNFARALRRQTGRAPHDVRRAE